MKTLHIYAQESWHGEAYIVGEPEAIRQLINALEFSLTSLDRTGVAEVMTNDGEGYHILVKAASEQQAGDIRLPYTDAEIGAKSLCGTPPWRLFDEPAV